MNRANLLRIAAGILASSSLATAAQAQSASTTLCTKVPFVVGFFNGVGASEAVAKAQAERLADSNRLGPRGPDGSDIEYQLFYNTTNGKLLDALETLNQKLREQPAVINQRFELFWEAIKGSGSLSDAIISADPAFVGVLQSLFETILSIQANALLRTYLLNPPFENYADHRTKVDNALTQGSKLIMFAHSQGNLFANRAYSYAVGKVGTGPVKLIHVAPASSVLNGPYTLADNDLIINGLLRLGGTVPSANVHIPSQGVGDGHGILSVYLNPLYSQPYNKIRSDFQAALSSAIAPPAEAQNGFFTVTLTWDGTGDVDLHTFEPGGAHVYYQNFNGQAGALDVDNTSANGPEHYYASCDSTRLQTGTYRIGINNYARATGRTATVQISSYRDGVLRTLSRPVGAERGSSGDSSPILVANVLVTKEQDTGKYKVAVE